MGDWTFFSNYGHVLVCLARNHDARLRDVAVEVGITERAVQKIVRDLQDADIVTVTKQGRCNRYRINKRKGLRHQLEAKCTVGQLLSLVTKPAQALRDSEPGEEAIPAETTPAKKIKQAPKAAPPPEPAAPARPSIASKPESPAEPAASTKPIDTRQQGNLF